MTGLTTSAPQQSSLTSSSLKRRSIPATWKSISNSATSLMCKFWGSITQGPLGRKRLVFILIIRNSNRKMGEVLRKELRAMMLIWNLKDGRNFWTYHQCFPTQDYWNLTLMLKVHWDSNFQAKASTWQLRAQHPRKAKQSSKSSMLQLASNQNWF